MNKESLMDRKPLANKTCEFLENCGFFKKYNVSKNLACRGFINMYCRGAKQGQCKRKQYRAEHGEPPSDDMMPSGHWVFPGGTLTGDPSEQDSP